MALKNVWIITDSQDSIGELCSGSHQLSDQVSVVLFGDQEDAKAAIAYGADSVYLFPKTGVIEGHSKSIAQLLRENNAQVVMVHPSGSGRLIAGKVAALLGVAMVSNMSSITASGEEIVVEHMVYGGVGFRKEKILSESVVVTVASGTFEAIAADASRVGSIVEMTAAADETGIRIIETKAKQGEVVNLAAAKKVVGVGRGFTKEEDLKMAEDLSALVGAELACTRPIAEGEKWMTKDRYIGVSGVMLKPDVYVALGVSGQIQHMVGVNPSRIMIAINKDKNAPIFKSVDFGLVADINTALPKIVEKLK